MKVLSFNVDLKVTARVNIPEDAVKLVIAESKDPSKVSKAAAAMLKNLGITELTEENVDLWAPVIIGKATREGVRDAITSEINDLVGLQVSGKVTPRKKAATQ